METLRIDLPVSHLNKYQLKTLVSTKKTVALHKNGSS